MTNGFPRLCACIAALGSQLLSLKKQILDFDRMIMAWHRSNQTSRRLNCIPGVGPLLATALVASVADPKAFRSGRNFSAWIGLVPKQHSSGGRERLGSISKQGDRYLRSLFVGNASCGNRSVAALFTVFRRFYGQVTNVSAQGADSAISLCRCICRYPTFVRRIAATRIAIFRLSSRWGPDTKQTSDAIPIETAAPACYDLFSV
jgi:Transposase IS116/IS110/IS902 family